jgi:hypothetical protein
MWVQKHFFNICVALVLVLFVAMWLTLLIQTWIFEPTDAVKTLVLHPVAVTLATTISGVLGNQTATALGFAVAEIKAANGQNGLLSPITVSLAKATKKLPPIAYIAGIVYAGVGVVVLISWFVKPQTTPETLSAFGLAALGWVLGAFTAGLNQGSNPPPPKSDSTPDRTSAAKAAE